MTLRHPVRHAYPGVSRVSDTEGELLPRIWLHSVLQRMWPQVVLLHLGSTEGHQEQPRVSMTTRVGLCLPRSLSPHPSPALGPRQSCGCERAMCFCAGCTHLPHAPSLIHNLFVSRAAWARFFLS